MFQNNGEAYLFKVVSVVWKEKRTVLVFILAFLVNSEASIEKVKAYYASLNPKNR